MGLWWTLYSCPTSKFYPMWKNIWHSEIQFPTPSGPFSDHTRSGKVIAIRCYLLVVDSWLLLAGQKVDSFVYKLRLSVLMLLRQIFQDECQTEALKTEHKIKAVILPFLQGNIHEIILLTSHQFWVGLVFGSHWKSPSKLHGYSTVTTWNGTQCQQQEEKSTLPIPQK